MPKASGVPGLPKVPGLPRLPGLPALPNVPAVLTTLPKAQPAGNVSSALKQAQSTVGGVTAVLGSRSTTTTTAPPPPPPPNTGPTTYPSGSTGFDISWPQCGGGYPPSSSVAVVGVNDGRAFSTNPCLGSEAGWAASARELYINLNSPSAVDGTDSAGPAGQCSANNGGCLAYNYGYNTAAASYDNAAGQGVRAKTWWLDVEVVGNCAPQFPTAGGGYWSCGQGLNEATVQGALDALRQRGLVAGIYSTSYQWNQITGGANPAGGAPPNWLAGASPSSPGSWCSGSHDFAAGPAWLLQFSPQPYDRDQAC
ncbi:MAG: hypothetical protein JO265_07995 [Acidimicrobiia bacterium]|nr:hypothetical protein [Acidimicrobiia bacterium]